MWPLNGMGDCAPNGYFLRDLLVFGGLRNGGSVAKGFVFEPPDFNNAPISERNEFQDQLALLLASLGEYQRMQVQWFCDCDYQRELLRYNEETQRATNVWTRRVRNERFVRYWQAMHERRLRRQRVILYFARQIIGAPPFSASREALTKHYEHLLGQLTQEFQQVQEVLSGVFSGQGARV